MSTDQQSGGWTRPTDSNLSSVFATSHAKTDDESGIEIDNIVRRFLDWYHQFAVENQAGAFEGIESSKPKPSR